MPAKQSPGSSEHSVQEGELIMSVMLILTLPRSVNIPSQERGDGFQSQVLSPVCPCCLAEASGSSPGVGFGQQDTC